MPPVTEIALVVGPMEPTTNRGLSGRRKLPRGRDRELGGAPVEGARLVLEPVLRQHQRSAAEGVGLDEVGAGREVGPVDVEDDIRPGADQDLVAALELRAAEVPGAEVLRLQHRPGRPVEHQDALRHDRAQLLRAVAAGRGDRASADWVFQFVHIKGKE